MQFTVHYFLHLVFPAAIAYLFFRKNRVKAYLVLLATMLVDLDHLLASPIFDACRCSINFHPLHSYWAIAAYVVLLFVPPTRIIAIGLLLHIITDSIDCWWSNYNCGVAPTAFFDGSFVRW